MRRTSAWLAVLACFLPLPCFASATDGTIDPLHSFAWSDRFGWVNFAADQGNVHVTAAGLTGYAWGHNVGWINLDPTNSGQRVRNDGAGHLSGFAWSAMKGWIDFTGVNIGSAGRFAGTGAVRSGGAVSFDCDRCDVLTDWRPAAVPSPSGGGGGPGSTCPPGTAGAYPDCRTIVVPPSAPAPPEIPSLPPDIPLDGATFATSRGEAPPGEAPYRADPVPDQSVGILDFNALIVHWGERMGDAATLFCRDKSASDINCDGTVDVLDFNLLMVYWGKPAAVRKQSPSL